MKLIIIFFRRVYMGKKRIQWNEQTYLRFLREGRGQGSGQEYIPWIKIHDFPSKGVCSRIYCEKTHRIHHLLSHNEENYFYMLSCDPLVTDIREQFPLRLSETLEIAKRMHIRHPQKGSFPFVLTTDFLISRGDRLEARTIKSAGELQNKRICEKFSIEYAYWKSKGIDWKIVTDRNINKDKALNCRCSASRLSSMSSFRITSCAALFRKSSFACTRIWISPFLQSVDLLNSGTPFRQEMHYVFSGTWSFRGGSL